MFRQFDQPGRSAVYAVNAMAATSHPLATATALSVLREGGNAVDAAIAASATLCVVEPHMTGIGGDCFAILAQPDGSVHALNGSGRSAQAARPETLRTETLTKIEDTSAHAVTVPGALRGWEELHAKFGSMDWVRLFSDAVDYALSGFPVAPRIALDWCGLVGKLNNNTGAQKHLLFDGGAPLAGQKIVLPALGNTLEKVARNGASVFYEGGIAEEIVSTLQRLGGVMEESDMAACRADWVEPISTDFCGRKVLEVPPNGQGITALIMLNLIEERASANEPGSVAHFHEMIELARIAYAMRDAHVADSDHLQTEVSRILSSETTKMLLRQFDPDTRNNGIELPHLKSSDTIYLSVVDRDGQAISFINSVFSGFGTGIVTEKTGIALQNRGVGFSLDPGHPNVLQGGKRPLHTIIPAMVLKDGLPEYAFGVMGGQYQPMGHAHVLVNMLKFAMNPQEALDFPRVFWDASGNILAESGVSGTAFSGLRKMGHTMQRGAADFAGHGGGQIIQIDRQSGTLIAGSDPRKDGHAGGY